VSPPGPAPRSLTRRASWFAILLAAIVGAWGACAPSTPGDTEPGDARVVVEVAALGLAGVGDVVWDLDLVHGGLDPGPAIVWQRRVASSRFGDGLGSATWVGPCDASPAAHPNTARLWVVGVYAEAVTSEGEFAAGDPSGVSGTPLAFADPTADGPLALEVPCAPNSDTPVRFDVTLVRPAQQGFFDVAVSFDDVFCSAKFDCCVEGADGGCERDITLLFDADGERATTFVLGFACTATPGGSATTTLYLDALELDCGGSGGPFVADLRLDPAGPPGNQCTAGAVSAAACDAVLSESPWLSAEDYLYQLGVYRGEELLVGANALYWNVALGVHRKDGAGPGVEDCRLRTRGTATGGVGASLTEGVIAEDVVYPYVAWDVDLGACASEGLTFDDPEAMVRVAYAMADAISFGFAFGHEGAGAFCHPGCVHGACVAGACDCDPGYEGDACDIDVDDCADAPCGDATAGTCVDGVASYTCLCHPGFYDDGVTCQPCEAITHCAEGLTCSGPGDETCEVCEPGHAGPSCAPVVDGVCGPADGETLAAPPVEDRCAAGTPTEVTGDEVYTWSCLGDNGGADASCAATAWPDGWTYRRAIEVADSSNDDQDEYQVMLTLDTEALILAGKLRADCGDLHVTDTDGVTPLPQWIARGCGAADTEVWVRMPNLIGGGSRLLYLYYGDPTAQGTHDAEAVFHATRFEDFAATSGWTGLGSYWSISGQRMNFALTESTTRRRVWREVAEGAGLAVRYMEVDFAVTSVGSHEHQQFTWSASTAALSYTSSSCNSGASDTGAHRHIGVHVRQGNSGTNRFSLHARATNIGGGAQVETRPMLTAQPSSAAYVMAIRNWQGELRYDLAVDGAHHSTATIDDFDWGGVSMPYLVGADRGRCGGSGRFVGGYVRHTLLHWGPVVSPEPTVTLGPEEE